MDGIGSLALDKGLGLPLAALAFVAGLLLAAGANPGRLGGLAGHDAALRLNFTDERGEAEARDLRLHLRGVLVAQGRLRQVSAAAEPADVEAGGLPRRGFAARGPGQ